MYVVKQIDKQTGGSRFADHFGTSMYFAMMLLSKTGTNDLPATNSMEVYMMLVFFIVGTLSFSYLIADYSATLMLANRSLYVFDRMENM